MTSNIEFELKARVKSSEEIRPLVGDILPIATSKGDKDVYFDTRDRALYRQGVFVRIRRAATLEIKAAPQAAGNDHLWCNELIVDASAGAEGLAPLGRFLSQFVDPLTTEWMNTRGLLAAFQLEQFVEVTKDRTVYELDGAEVVLDFVTDLGLFVEIEVKDQAKRSYFAELARECGLKHIRTGYVELLLRKIEPDTYRKGRYLLEEDHTPGDVTERE